MRVLLAGGTGFLGRAALSALTGLDHVEVLVLSRRGAPDPESGRAQVPTNVRHIAGDWTEASRDQRILSFSPDVVVNLVGERHPRSSIGREVEEIREQVLPFLELIEALEPKGLQRVVFSSSAGSIYRSGRVAVAKERSDTAYHSTKRSIEHYLSSRCQATDLTAVSLRISNPIGDLDRPGFGLVGHLARSVTRGDEIEFFGDYATPKDYVALEDVGDAVAAAISAKGAGSGSSSGADSGHSVVDVGSGWAIDAPGMAKLVRSLSEAGFDAGRSPLDHGFAPSALDLEPMALLTGWRPRHDVVASVDRLLRRYAEGDRA